MKPADTTIEMSNMVSTPKNPFAESFTSTSEHPHPPNENVSPSSADPFADPFGVTQGVL